ncbi:MAG: hypothetical protein PVH26_05425 [Desulfosarcina sp.]|jgi:hypothetical protein
MPNRPLQATELMGGQRLTIRKSGHKSMLMHIGFLQADVGQAGCTKPAGLRFFLASGTQKSGAQRGVHQKIVTAPLLDDASTGHKERPV